VLDVELALPHAHENFDEQGRLIGAGYAQQLLEVVDAIVAAVEGRRAAIAEQVAV